MSRPSSKIHAMPPPSRRPASSFRAHTATPLLAGRSSLAESIASTTRIQSPVSSVAGMKRKERDYDHNVGDGETNIKVVVRCRGRSEREVREHNDVVVSTNGVKGKTVELSMGPSALSNKTYYFDKVYSPAADQLMIFNDIVVPILDDVFSLFHAGVYFQDLLRFRFFAVSTVQFLRTARQGLARHTLCRATLQISFHCPIRRVLFLASCTNYLQN